MIEITIGIYPVVIEYMISFLIPRAAGKSYEPHSHDLNV